MSLEIPEVNSKEFTHSIESSYRDSNQIGAYSSHVSLNVNFKNKSDCNEMVRFLTCVIDDMTVEGE